MPVLENKYKNAGKHWEEIKVPAENKRGFKKTYKYIGNFYTYMFPNFDMKTVKMLQIIISLCFVAVFSYTISRPVKMNASFFVGGFSLLAAVAELFCLYGIVFFTVSKESMTLYRYKESRGAIYFGACLASLFLIISFGAYLYFMIFEGTANLMGDLLAALGYLVSIILEIPLIVFQNKKNYTEVYNIRHTSA